MREYPKPKRWAYFLSSFTLTFLVLGAFTSVMVIYLYTGLGDSGEASPEQVGASVYIPRESDDMTLLTVVESQENRGIFLLVRYNPSKGKIPVVSLPPQMLVESPPSPKTLQELYDTQGITALRSGLEQLLGISIDRHCITSREGFLAIAEKFGPVEFTLEEELALSPQSGGVILGAGKQRLDGQTLLRLMEYQGYAQGEKERMEMISDLAAQAINQKLELLSGAQGESLFRAAVNQMKTDLSFVDYDARLSSARMMADLKAQPAQALPLEGRYNQAEDLFSLSEVTKNLIQDRFR